MLNMQSSCAYIKNIYIKTAEKCMHIKVYKYISSSKVNVYSIQVRLSGVFMASFIVVLHMYSFLLLEPDSHT